MTNECKMGEFLVAKLKKPIKPMSLRGDNFFGGSAIFGDLLLKANPLAE